MQSNGDPCAAAPKQVRVEDRVVVIDYNATAKECWSSLTSYVTTIQVNLPVPGELTVKGLNLQPGIPDFTVPATQA